MLWTAGTQIKTIRIIRIRLEVEQRRVVVALTALLEDLALLEVLVALLEQVQE